MFHRSQICLSLKHMYNSYYDHFSIDSDSLLLIFIGLRLSVVYISMALWTLSP